MAAGDLHFTFEDIISALVFFAAVWGAGKAVERFAIPALVGELLCGCLLGPPLAGFINAHEAFTLSLMGEIGLLLVVEAGLEVDLAVLKQVGIRGLAIGVTGSLTPLALGAGIASAFGMSWRSALAAGACLSPTSMGVALVVLRKGGALNTPTGQLVVAAAVIDDVGRRPRARAGRW